MSKIKVGVIGAGGIVRRLHLPDLDQNDNFEVVLISGRKESRLKQQCEAFGIPNWTQNYEAVISDDSVDAIVVGTPHPHHVSWGIKAIETGKHVLMQKPLCGDMNEANDFVEAVEKSNHTVMCLPHFSSQVYKIRQMITEGAIGRVSGARYRTSHGGPEIYYAEIRDLFGETDDDLWFFDAKRASVGALFDMGVYAISHLVAILGSFAKVLASLQHLTNPQIWRMSLPWFCKPSLEPSLRQKLVGVILPVREKVVSTEQQESSPFRGEMEPQSVCIHQPPIPENTRLLTFSR